MEDSHKFLFGIVRLWTHLEYRGPAATGKYKLHIHLYIFGRLSYSASIRTNYSELNASVR